MELVSKAVQARSRAIHTGADDLVKGFLLEAFYLALMTGKQRFDKNYLTLPQGATAPYGLPGDLSLHQGERWSMAGAVATGGASRMPANVDVEAVVERSRRAFRLQPGPVQLEQIEKGPDVSGVFYRNLEPQRPVQQQRMPSGPVASKRGRGDADSAGPTHSGMSHGGSVGGAHSYDSHKRVRTG